MLISIAQFKESCKRHLMVIILVALAIAEIASLSFVLGVQPDGIVPVRPVSENVVTKPVFRISEIRGPMIDDRAAMIVADESSEFSCTTQAIASACSTLPLDIWAFLLIAYAALLVFNFSYTFRRAVKPQWGWETLYTALAVIAWYAWDGCRDHLWFPFAVVKSGLIIFAVYAYLLEKKLLEKEKQDTAQKA